jgi:hypothetical protein
MNSFVGTTVILFQRPSSFLHPSVLQTVGYGNYVPDTSSGRAMVMTLGFISILAFAGILVVAGMIASALFDDCLVRLRLKALTHPAVAMFVWASLYYSWMVSKFHPGYFFLCPLVTNSR